MFPLFSLFPGEVVEEEVGNVECTDVVHLGVQFKAQVHLTVSGHHVMYHRFVLVSELVRLPF